MKKLIAIILMIFSTVGHTVTPAEPIWITEPENCAQFENELDFKKPYMRLTSCRRIGGIGNPLSITYYVLGKYGKQMEQDLIKKFNILPLETRHQDDVWSSETILENYYSDERVLVILVGMSDWGAKTRDDWERDDIQFLIKFTKHPQLW